MTMIYIEWSHVLSCFTLDAILIPSCINSTYTLLCFHTSLVSCHNYWPKECETVTRNHFIYTMPMVITLEGLQVLKRLEGKFWYVQVKNCPLSAYCKTYPWPYREVVQPICWISETFTWTEMSIWIQHPCHNKAFSLEPWSSQSKNHVWLIYLRNNEPQMGGLLETLKELRHTATTE